MDMATLHREPGEQKMNRLLIASSLAGLVAVGGASPLLANGTVNGAAAGAVGGAVVAGPVGAVVGGVGGAVIGHHVSAHHRRHHYYHHHPVAADTHSSN
jgi:uncharacterized membrane protein